MPVTIATVQLVTTMGVTGTSMTTSSGTSGDHFDSAALPRRNQCLGVVAGFE